MDETRPGLPDGWTTEYDPLASGAHMIVRDEMGAEVGRYGWVRTSYRHEPSGHWSTGGRRMPSEQACIDYLERARQ